jgi:predicted nucleotidyltransferase
MIEKLFTSKIRVKLLEYFFFCKDNGRVREISLITNLPISAVSRELKNLVSLGILSKNKNNFILNNFNYLEDLKNILLKTDSFAFLFKNKFKSVNFCFVFGSFANNNYNNESDIDLFIIGDLSLNETLKIIKPIENKLKRTINPIVWTESEFQKNKSKSFIKDILSKKIIMIKGDENEFRKFAK